ncbi:hypothetical protein VTI74DRAFT_3454 [Chaetomium olivicolor]
MATAKPLVLITGATGFLGFLTLVELLRSGYRVRAAVRSETKTDNIRKHPLVSALISESPEGGDRLSFVVVPDLAVPGAFDSAVEGASYVIHLAAPVPSFSGAATVGPEQYDKYFVQDTVNATLGILNSCAGAAGAGNDDGGVTGVKRIILTSSAVAVIPFAYLAASPEVDYNVRFGPESRQPTPSGPFGSEIEAYSAGKTAALNAAEEWIASQQGDRAGFDIVSILSGWTFGRDELVHSAAEMRVRGTNSVLLGLLLGNKSDWPFNGNAVLAADVARVHVLALNAPQVETKDKRRSQTFVTSTPIVWEDAVRVVRSEFAADVEAGRLSVDGKQPTQPIHFDGSNTEEVLGIKFAPFREAVRQVAALISEFTKPSPRLEN